MKGIILAAGKGTRLYPLTNYVNKHLLPVYNKPMIYYPITTLILAGCKKICIVINKKDVSIYKKLQEQLLLLNVMVELQVQDREKSGLPSALLHGENFADGDSVLLILGDNIFFGNNFINNLLDEIQEKACIVLKKVKDPSSYGVIRRNGYGEIQEFIEKPQTYVSNEAVTGLYYFPSDVFDLCKRLEPSDRNETEITDLLNHYLANKNLKTYALPRGVAWLDTGTVENLSNSGSFVRTIEARSLETFGYIEEAAYHKGLVTESEFKSIVHSMQDSHYKSYLETVCER